MTSVGAAVLERPDASRSASASASPCEAGGPVWISDPAAAHFAGEGLLSIAHAIREPAFVLRAPNGAIGLALGGEMASAGPGLSLLGIVPAFYPEWLGDRSFNERYGTRFAYVVGEMAHGIASPAMAIAAGRAGMLGFIGTAGLSPARIEAMVREVQAALSPLGRAFGANLIHTPGEPALEHAIADIFCRLNVPAVSASAFMSLTPAIVRLSASGMRRDAEGRVVRARAIFAKISRPETAKLFMSPPPAAMLRALVAEGHLTPEEAELAAELPLAEDITVEGDSGGHTDNRPLAVALARVAQLRDSLAPKTRIRIGAAGGLGTPQAVASAFALGADYVLTGSVNQSSVESGLSAQARAMLQHIDMADVAMAASADMFELGVKVQVLKRGTMFAGRANRLFDLYTRYDSLSALPPETQRQLEQDFFRAPLEKIWEETCSFFAERNPAEITRAEKDLKHQMALVFRWYLGNSIRWAMTGEESRKIDFQIWCGPAMGAFNAWSQGSHFDTPEARTVEQIGKNLLEGAATLLRAQAFRSMGVGLPPTAFQFTPRRLQ
jgi:PfaD family protein